MTNAERDELLKFLHRQKQPLESLTGEGLREQLDRFLTFQEALTLAIEERTGQPVPEEGCAYTEADYDRAQEILLLYPAAGG